MTIEEAKKAGFRIDAEGWATTWRILKTEKIRRLYSKVRGLDAKDFQTRAKARDALRKRKIEAATKREDARGEARKAAGTQVPPPAPTETPAEKDARNTPWLANHGKSVESHETPVGETQGKEVVTDETQDPEPVKCIMDGDEFCGITPEWKAWSARRDTKASNKEPVAPVEVIPTNASESVKLSNKSDAVSHPSHYTSHPSGVECITITKHMNFCRGNAVKYLWRAGQKGDSLEKEIEDIAKAEEYCRVEKERLIAKKGAK